MWYCLYVESKKWYKWTYLQNRNRLREWIYGYQGEVGMQKVDSEFGIDMYTLLCLK